MEALTIILLFLLGVVICTTYTVCLIVVTGAIAELAITITEEVSKTVRHRITNRWQYKIKKTEQKNK